MRSDAGHTACGLYAHVTWHTWRRIRQIRAGDVRLLCDAVLAAGRRTRVRVHAQAVLSDHVHVLISYPPDVALANFVREAKSESARRINTARLDAERVRWCRGYYAGSLSRSHVTPTRYYLGLQFHRHPDRIPR